MAVIEMELTDLWGRVIDVVAADAPQHRAFLSLTKPLGLLQSDGTTNLLVAAPNAFAKDVLETRLRALVSEVLTRELGEKTNIAVTIDETLEATDLPAPDVDIEIVPARAGTGREDVATHATIKHFWNLQDGYFLRISWGLLTKMQKKKHAA